MNYTRPNITEGPWRLSEENNVWSDNGERIANVCQPPHESPEANARAISALPQVLAALESAYNRACEAVEKHFYSRGRMRKQVWHSEENTRKQLEAIRDEYKTALTAAGYSFQ